MSGPWEDFGGPAQAADAGPWQDFAPSAPVRGIGEPEEELTFGEKSWMGLRDIAGRIDNAIGSRMIGAAAESLPNIRGSAVGRVAMGMADPGAAAVQLAANLVGAGEPVNRRIAEVEAQYQAARKAEGSEGFDPARLAGNVAITAPLGMIGAPARTAAGMAAKGAVQGAAGGALAPVADADGLADFLQKKAAQTASGAAGGAILSPVAGALARVVSPEASRDAGLKLLREAGVRPTIGQALGGAANQIEQKSTSIPFIGDMIARARHAARDTFDDAMINQAARSIGRKAPASGSVSEKLAAIKAGKSADYDEALRLVDHVNFDTPQFNFDLKKLTSMADALPKSLRKVFQQELDDSVIGNMSPNGSMLPETFQEAVSGLKATERAWRKAALSDPRNGKLADAVQELRKALENEAGRQNPQFAAVKRMVDMADAKLRPVTAAAETAKNQADGAFTPAQAKTALFRSGRKAPDDEAVRLATEAQRIIGNTVPDSGTAGRLLNLGTAASGFHNPLIPAAFGLGALAYAPPVQRALVAAVSRRPDIAPELANRLRLYLSGPLGLAGGFGAAGMQ